MATVRLRASSLTLCVGICLCPPRMMSDQISSDTTITSCFLYSSMARSSSPNSAGSQFFIMHEDAKHLDGQYAAFGKVTEGMDVVDAIANTKTGPADRPVAEQKIASIRVDTQGETYPEPEKLADPYGRF